MDIMVEGVGEMRFTPDKITINYDFNCKEKTYESALTNGTKIVENYFDMIVGMGFKKEDLKTRSFRVSENKVYNNEQRKYYPDGFTFNQRVVLEFNYDRKLLSRIMESTSKLTTPPTYTIEFGVKDNKEVEEKILQLAYNDAQFHAEAISRASGKVLKDCVKVSFQPFDADVVSSSRLDSREMMCYSKASARGVSESIENTFVPEDIVINKTIYCLFVTE